MQSLRPSISQPAIKWFKVIKVEHTIYPLFCFSRDNFESQLKYLSHSSRSLEVWASKTPCRCYLFVRAHFGSSKFYLRIWSFCGSSREDFIEPWVSQNLFDWRAFFGSLFNHRLYDELDPVWNPWEPPWLCLILWIGLMCGSISVLLAYDLVEKLAKLPNVTALAVGLASLYLRWKQGGARIFRAFKLLAFRLKWQDWIEASKAANFVDLSGCGFRARSSLSHPDEIGAYVSMDGTSLVHAIKNLTNFSNYFLGKAFIVHMLCTPVHYTCKWTLANVLKDTV